MDYKKCLLFFLCLSYKCAAQLTILPTFGDKPMAENTWYVSKNGDSIQFDNIRFYLSNIYAEDIDNQIVRDSTNAHLVDIFEPNSWIIPLKNRNGKRFKKIHFDIGINSVTNVSGALSGDLDPQKGMYWAWQSGYVNLKIEGKSPQSKNRKNVFQYHIGGYLTPFYALKHVELPINSQNTEGSFLKIDFSNFFEKIDIATQNSIMMPCTQAMQLADYSVLMFSIR
jgi:hypothetical protein